MKIKPDTDLIPIGSQEGSFAAPQVLSESETRKVEGMMNTTNHRDVYKEEESGIPPAPMVDIDHTSQWRWGGLHEKYTLYNSPYQIRNLITSSMKLCFNQSQDLVHLLKITIMIIVLIPLSILLSSLYKIIIFSSNKRTFNLNNTFSELIMIL